MKTTTRASFADANACHASTAQGPLLRPEGVIMPSRSNPTPREAQRAHWAEHPDQHCLAIAAAYGRALRDPQLQLPATCELKRSARRWLRSQLAKLAALGFMPEPVDREVPLAEAVSRFSCTLQWASLMVIDVPVSTIGNDDSHPVWSPWENLLFRFVHDYHHKVTGANDTFAGELTVARYCINAPVCEDLNLQAFLASEIIGQAAYRITCGSFPKQIIATNILEFIK